MKNNRPVILKCQYQNIERWYPDTTHRARIPAFSSFSKWVNVEVNILTEGLFHIFIWKQ